MRVAFLLGAFPVISETFILNQITGLLDLGVDVEVFTLCISKEKKVHPDIEKYRLISQVHSLKIPKNALYRRIKVLFLLFCNIKHSALLLKTLFNIYRQRKTPLIQQRGRLLKSFYFFLSFLLNREFDIIHCHFGNIGEFGITLKNIFPEYKIITSFYGADLSKYVKQHGKEYYQELFHRGDLFLPLSQCFASKLKELGCNEAKIIVHSIGVDMTRFVSSGRNYNKRNNIILLTVGRFVEKKGYEYSIRAVAKLLEQHQDMKYLIAGEGPLKKNLVMLASELKITKNIEFLGTINQNEAIELYKKADIFILPSVTAKSGDKEGTPTVLIEAQATGLPVVSTFHSGIPEIVENGKSGFLVQERDVNTLAEKIDFLIQHPELREEMGRYGRKFVEQKFDIKKLNKRLVEIYSNLLGNSQ